MSNRHSSVYIFEFNITTFCFLSVNKHCLSWNTKVDPILVN